MVCDEPRICRAIFSYPTSSYPGAGLPSYYLSQYIPFHTLLLTRHLKGKKRSIESHVKVKCFRCPNPSLSGTRTALQRLLRGVLKLLGIFIFTVQAVPFMTWFRPHILHIHTHLPLPLGVIGRLVGAKVIVNFHGTDLLAVRRSRLLKLLCRAAVQEIWYVSVAMHETLSDMFPGVKMVHLPSGVDLSLFQKKGSQRTFKETFL